ncbi:PAQR family membrane homeostasis protein TrhA [Shewanella aestuarii]|uniref:Hemolysin III family protein n=1 Tax=Shewanella aestuarii TaxID=1028752 RepID=A0A6G9QIY9_9GAMM|nr:hemolysin III family protein [Shewanella aestuarii]QIR14510.1 hemolysin III family protein [Shewanella aestuarii]
MSLETDIKIATPLTSNTSDYSINEEIANSLSHAAGVVAGIIGLIFMLTHARNDLTLMQLTGITIYGCSIIVLFLASTLYHSSKTSVWRKRFKMADHCAIYTLIAGTYTPLMLISLQNDNALNVLTAIWCLAFGGIVFKTLFIGRFKQFSLVLYLIMGWLCITVMKDLIANMSGMAFGLLLGGGLFYSLGVIFYINKKIPFNHAIWHLFVLAGAFSHFFCIYLTVI